MGGIVLRAYLAEAELPELGRVVMLAPPNQGSEVVDFYLDYPAFEWFAGPAGLELGTGAASVPRALGPVEFDVGVIAGTDDDANNLSTGVLSQFSRGSEHDIADIRNLTSQMFNDDKNILAHFGVVVHD